MISLLFLEVPYEASWTMLLIYAKFGPGAWCAYGRWSHASLGCFATEWHFFQFVPPSQCPSSTTLLVLLKKKGKQTGCDYQFTDFVQIWWCLCWQVCLLFPVYLYLLQNRHVATRILLCSLHWNVTSWFYCSLYVPCGVGCVWGRAVHEARASRMDMFSKLQEEVDGCFLGCTDK